MLTKPLAHGMWAQCNRKGLGLQASYKFLNTNSATNASNRDLHMKRISCGLSRRVMPMRTPLACSTTPNPLIGFRLGLGLPGANPHKSDPALNGLATSSRA